MTKRTIILIISIILFLMLIGAGFVYFFLRSDVKNTNNRNQPTANSESHFGVHLGSLSYDSATTYINELGSQIWVRDGAPIRDDYGWKKTGYSNPPSRSALPPFQSNRFLNFIASRYDDNPPQIATPAYPHNHEKNYTEYVDYLIKGFKDSVKYWEIENEVDAKIFWAGTPQDYANLVVLASKEIKSQCPSCKVGVSFSSPNIAKNKEYFSAIGQICSSFDFMDIHSVLGQFIQPGELNRWKQICPDKEFISTETGVPDTLSSKKSQASGNQAGGSRESQAQDLIKYNTLMFGEGYNKIFWYLIDTDYKTIDIFLYNALLDETQAKKPAFSSYKTMINKVDYFTSLTKLTNGQYKYTFSNRNPVYVLWCDSSSCSLPAEISGTVKVTDYLGNAETKSANQVRLTNSPIFVE